MKIVIIGSGSVYTPEVISEIIKRNKILNVNNICMVDLPNGKKQAEIVLRFSKRMIAASGEKIDVDLIYNRKEAMQNADYVISQYREGTYQSRIDDELTGLSLGLLGQETTGVGGFLNAMRTIPSALEIAEDMNDICPDAWMINFTNPAGIVTEAVLKHSSIRCIGLCNVPINMQQDLSSILKVDRSNLQCRFTGLNHLSFVTGVSLDGENVLPKIIQRIGEGTTSMKNIPKVDDVSLLIKDIGIIPSPYLQYYYYESEMYTKQKQEWESNHETRGMKTKIINDELYRVFDSESVFEIPQTLSERGGSLYSYVALEVIEALESKQPKELVINTQNRGAIPDLYDDDVVEINCMVSKEGIKSIQQPNLPKQVSGLIQTVKQYERLTVEAASVRSSKSALYALLNHPLIHGYKNAHKIIELLEKKYES